MQTVFLPIFRSLSILRLIWGLPLRTASGAAERLHIQGRHVSEKMYFQGDDSEFKECGRGCKQHDPSGSVPPHVIAHYSGSLGIRARPDYNRQGDEIHLHTLVQYVAALCKHAGAAYLHEAGSGGCTLLYSLLLFKNTLRSDRRSSRRVGAGLGFAFFFFLLICGKSCFT